MESATQTRSRFDEPTVEIRVRVTLPEKRLLERAAGNDDRSLSNFVRHTVLLALSSLGPKEFKEFKDGRQS